MDRIDVQYVIVIGHSIQFEFDFKSIRSNDNIARINEVILREYCVFGDRLIFSELIHGNYHAFNYLQCAHISNMHNEFTENQ